MNQTQGFVAIVLTIVLTAVLTLGAVFFVLTSLGKQEVVNEVSPFVETAKDKITEVVVPDVKKPDEPKTEADQIMDAVAQNQGSSVLIFKADGGTGKFIARGLVLTSDGYLLTDKNSVSGTGVYSVVVPGMKDRLVAQKIAEKDSLALLKIDLNTSLLGTFSDDVPTLKDLVVAVTGNEKMSIATGIVTTIDTTTGVIGTNLVGAIAPGSLLVSKNGSIVGLSTVSVQRGSEASFVLLTKSIIDGLLTLGGTQN
jgi:hypothetical protein